MTVCTMIDGTRMTLVGRISTDVDGGRWNADDVDGADWHGCKWWEMERG